MRRVAIVVGVLSLVLSLNGVPWAVSDYPNYTAAQLKSRLDRGDDIFLLCPLAELVFNEKNIPGSVNLPLKGIMKTKKLPQNKDTQIVTYCLGPK